MSTIATTTSKNGKTIKLTAQRWFHITESHDYMAGYFHDVLETMNGLDYIIAGSKYLICCYREKNKEGFVITAFMTSKIDSILKRRKILWRRQ